MPKVEWSNELSVNISKFDNEHKELIKLINKLDEAMSHGQGQKIIAGVLSELANYTITHFKNEEVIMEKHNYPGYTEHKSYHTEFVNKVKDVQSQYNSGAMSLSISVRNFLISWVKNHIMQADKAYSEYYQKNNIVV
jgi:hemerythrin-like metal-binding protein